MKTILALFFLVLALGAALAGPRRVSSPCSNGQCSSGVCTPVMAPVAFEIPVAREALVPATKEIVKAPCACGVACPCGDQQVSYRAAPAQPTTYQEIPAASAGFSRPQRNGLLARIFHRRR